MGKKNPETSEKKHFHCICKCFHGSTILFEAMPGSDKNGLFVLRFSDPVNTINVMSINLTTLFLGKISKRLTSISPLTDNCPTLAVGREWLQKLFHDQISMEDMWSNPGPPEYKWEGISH